MLDDWNEPHGNDRLTEQRLSAGTGSNQLTHIKCTDFGMLLEEAVGGSTSEW